MAWCSNNNLDTFWALGFLFLSQEAAAADAHAASDTDEDWGHDSKNQEPITTFANAVLVVNRQACFTVIAIPVPCMIVVGFIVIVVVLIEGVVVVVAFDQVDVGLVSVAIVVIIVEFSSFIEICCNSILGEVSLLVMRAKHGGTQNCESQCGGLVTEHL